MSNGLSKVVDDLESQDRERECAGLSGRCPQCERQGFPILPVRYAVCKRLPSNEDIPELPADRVSDFTDITLDKALENGVEVDKKINSRVLNYVGGDRRGRVCKYILRQLRPGYFYVFDQNNRPYYWYAYVVSAEGMYHQYSVHEAPPSPKDASFSCMHAPEDERRAKALSASIVTLPRVAKGDVFYYAYTEHPWSREHLSMIEGDAEWREKNMQKFVITGQPSPPSSRNSAGEQRTTFGLEDLSLIAEYSAGSVERMDFFWPAGGERRLFSREEMTENMRERLTGYENWLHGQEMILGVKDEVGIIDELNSYRLEPLSDMKEFVNRDDNKRKLGIMQALDAFKENFKRAQELAIEQKYEGPDTPYEETRNWHLEQLKRSAENTTDDGVRAVLEARIERLEAENERMNQNQERSRKKETERVGDWVDKRDDQIEGYYSNNRGVVDDFRASYARQAELTEWSTMYYDADYALWVRDHLMAVIDRYSVDDYPSGLGVSGLVASLLLGGITSQSSFSAWERLAQEIKSPDAVLPRVLFANNRDLVAAAVADASASGAEEYLMAGSWKDGKSDITI